MRKTVIAGGAEEQDYTLTKGEKGFIADGSHKGVHMSIFPRGYNNDTTEFNVVFSAENSDGSPNFGKIYNSSIIDLNPEDVAEAAGMYMNRLKSGVRPEDMFRDMEEANREAMLGLLEKIKKS